MGDTSGVLGPLQAKLEHLSEDDFAKYQIKKSKDGKYTLEKKPAIINIFKQSRRAENVQEVTELLHRSFQERKQLNYPKFISLLRHCSKPQEPQKEAIDALESNIKIVQNVFSKEFSKIIKYIKKDDKISLESINKLINSIPKEISILSYSSVLQANKREIFSLIAKKIKDSEIGALGEALSKIKEFDKTLAGKSESGVVQRVIQEKQLEQVLSSTTFENQIEKFLSLLTSLLALGKPKQEIADLLSQKLRSLPPLPLKIASKLDQFQIKNAFPREVNDLSKKHLWPAEHSVKEIKNRMHRDKNIEEFEFHLKNLSWHLDAKDVDQFLKEPKVYEVYKKIRDEILGKRNTAALSTLEAVQKIGKRTGAIDNEIAIAIADRKLAECKPSDDGFEDAYVTTILQSCAELIKHRQPIRDQLAQNLQKVDAISFANCNKLKNFLKINHLGHIEHVDTLHKTAQARVDKLKDEMFALGEKFIENPAQHYDELLAIQAKLIEDYGSAELENDQQIQFFNEKIEHEMHRFFATPAGENPIEVPVSTLQPSEEVTFEYLNKDDNSLFLEWRDLFPNLKAAADTLWRATAKQIPPMLHFSIKDREIELKLDTLVRETKEKASAKALETLFVVKLADTVFTQLRKEFPQAKEQDLKKLVAEALTLYAIELNPCGMLPSQLFSLIKSQQSLPFSAPEEKRSYELSFFEEGRQVSSTLRMTQMYQIRSTEGEIPDTLPQEIQFTSSLEKQGDVWTGTLRRRIEKAPAKAFETPRGVKRKEFTDTQYQKAKKFVLGLEREQVTVSTLHRHLKFSLERAKLLIDMLEQSGIVGPQEREKPRKVRPPKDEFEEISL